VRAKQVLRREQFIPASGIAAVVVGLLQMLVSPTPHTRSLVPRDEG